MRNPVDKMHRYDYEFSNIHMPLNRSLRMTPRYSTMLKSLLFLFLTVLTTVALPRLAPVSQNPAPPAAQSGRISIRGMVTNPVTAEGVPGIQINLIPVDARGAIAQDPQALREAATRAGIAAEEVERLVAAQGARAAQLA